MEEEAVVAPVKILYRGHEIWVFAQDDGIPVGTAVILENNIQVMSIPPSRFDNILLAEAQVLRHAKFWVDHHLRATSQISAPSVLRLKRKSQNDTLPSAVKTHE